MKIDEVDVLFTIWAEWVVRWGRKLYPSFAWGYLVGYSTSFFTTDKFLVKARQLTGLLSRGECEYTLRQKRGVIIEFTLEDTLRLQELDPYLRVEILKSILRQAMREAKVVQPGLHYEVFHKSIAQEEKGVL